MENIANTNEIPVPEANNDFYHDNVDTFELSYKITQHTEKPDPVIHYHECFELIFYISAHIEAYLDDLHYTLNSHDVLVIPPRKMHKIIYPERQNYIRYVFYFTQEHIERAFSPILLKKALNLFMDQGHYKVSLSAPEYLRINNVFHNMHEHKSDHSARSLYLQSTYASVILQEIYIIYSSHPSEELDHRSLTPVEQILRYINDNFSQNITLEDLEEKFYLNKSYICRIFRKTMGISLINYLQHKRILESQQLLLNSDHSIIEIGLECGFSNVQHFYRVFKKITNLTPNEYKKHQLSATLGQTISLLPKDRRQ